MDIHAVKFEAAIVGNKSQASTFRAYTRGFISFLALIAAHVALQCLARLSRNYKHEIAEISL